MTIEQQLAQFVKNNKPNFEIGRFKGDIFWYNHTAFYKLARKIGIIFFLIYPKNEPKNYWLVMDKESLKRAGKRLYPKWSKNYKKFRSIFYQYLKEIEGGIQNLTKMSQFNTRTYLKFAHSFSTLAQLVVFSTEALEIFLEEKLKSIIPDAQKRNILLFPLYESYVQKQTKGVIKILEKLSSQERSLLKKGIKSFSRNPHIKKALEKYCQDQGWAFLNFGSQRLPNNLELARFLQTIYKNLAKEKNDLKEAEHKRRQKLALLKKISSPQRKLIELVDALYELRDQRKAFFIKIIVPIKNWFKRLAPKYSLTYDDIRWLTCQEQIVLDKTAPKIRKEKYLKIVKQRKNNCLCVYGYKNDYRLITGKAAAPIIRLIFKKEKQKILQGIPAFGGIVTGQVKIIKDKGEFPKFKKGEILVTTHTTPDFVPLMKKAMAILTQRGGVTSHAAIISRELGVPCVVGINGLVDSLKTGNTVKVDAKRGIVEIIK